MKRILISIVILLFLTGCSEDTTQKYNVSFETNSETVIESVSVDSWGSVLEPDIPIKEEYEFLGWYSDSSLNHIYDFINPITDNLTLFAKWEANQYDITFLDKDGSILYVIKTDYGYDLDLLHIINPSRTGYVFLNWDELPNTMPAEDITVIAIYTARQYMVRYLDFDGTEITSEQFAYKDELEDFVIPQDPSMIGYEFIEWTEELPSTMPAQDIIVTARYIINTYTIQYLDYDGTMIQSESHYYGFHFSEIDIPIVDERAGFIFVGWDDLPNTMPPENIIVTATYLAIHAQFSAGDNEIYGETIEVEGDYIVVSKQNIDLQWQTYLYKISDPSYERLIGDIDARSIQIKGDYIFILFEEGIYVYKISDLLYERIIIGSDSLPNDSFGYEIIIEGDYIIVSAYRHNELRGAVYVYKISDPSYERKIIGKDIVELSRFGLKMQVEGDYLTIYTRRYNNELGGIFVYKLSDPLYERIITGAEDEVIYFRNNYGIEGDYIIVSVFYADDVESAVHLYKLSDPSFERKIVASDLLPFESFANEIKIEGDYIIVSAFYSNDGRGAVYVFKTTDPSYERKIVASELWEISRFGIYLQVEGDYIFISAFDDNNSGTIFIYKLSDSAYERKLVSYPIGLYCMNFEVPETDVFVEGDYIFIIKDYDMFKYAIYKYKISDPLYEKFIFKNSESNYFTMKVEGEYLVILSETYNKIYVIEYPLY